MILVDKEARVERRREQAEGVRALEGSGVLDGLYAMIDAGQIQFDGKGWLDPAGGQGWS